MPAVGQHKGGPLCQLRVVSRQVRLPREEGREVVLSREGEGFCGGWHCECGRMWFVCVGFFCLNPGVRFVESDIKTK